MATGLGAAQLQDAERLNLLLLTELLPCTRSARSDCGSLSGVGSGRKRSVTLCNMIVFQCNYKGMDDRLGSAHLEGVRQFSGKSTIVTSAGNGIVRACG